jgi:hypothetical protein
VMNQYELLMSRSCKSLENALPEKADNLEYPNVSIKLVLKNASKWLNSDDFPRKQYEPCLQSWKRLYTNVRVMTTASNDIQPVVDDESEIVVDARTFLLRRLSSTIIKRDLCEIDLSTCSNTSLKKYIVHFPEMHDSQQFAKEYNFHDTTLHQLQRNLTKRDNNNDEYKDNFSTRHVAVIVFATLTGLLLTLLAIIAGLYFGNEKTK